jgi:hypothetical protein
LASTSSSWAGGAALIDRARAADRRRSPARALPTAVEPLGPGGPAAAEDGWPGALAPANRAVISAVHGHAHAGLVSIEARVLYGRYTGVVGGSDRKAGHRGCRRDRRKR